MSARRTPGLASLLAGTALLLAACFARAARAQSNVEGSILVALGQIDPEIHERLSGYLTGTRWSVRRVLVQPNNSIEALRVARAHGGAAAFWTPRAEATRLQLRIIDVSTETMSVRSLRFDSRSDPLARSTVYETAALVLHATLQSIEQGSAIGEIVEPPAAEPLAPPPPPPRLTPQAPLNQEILSLLVDAQWQLFLNDGSLVHGPKLAVGTRLGRWWLLATGRFALPRTVSTEAAGESVAFRLHEFSLGVGVGRQFPLPQRWSLDLGISAAAASIQREQAIAGTELVPASEHQTWMPEVATFLGVQTPTWGRRGPALILHGGAALFTLRPRWQVDENSETDAQWAFFQPWMSLGLRLDFQ